MLRIFKRFYGFIWKRKLWFLAAMLATTIAYVAELLSPYFFKLFVEALQKNDLPGLYRLVSIFIGVLFAGLIFSNLKYLLGDVVSVDTAIDIRSRIFKYVQDLDFSFHTSKSTGSLILSQKDINEMRISKGKAPLDRAEFDRKQKEDYTGYEDISF